MLELSDKSIAKVSFINILFMALPASFIAGNLVLNLNVILIIFSALIFYNLEIFKIRIFLIDKLIIVLFLFILMTGIYNNISTWYFIEDTHRETTVIIKTVSYLRYLILYFVIRYLIDKKIINFKLFFISCSFCSIFVSLDIFYQFIFGKDIFGFPKIGRNFSGPFGEELIAGGYIQRFSIFSFFLLPIFLVKDNKSIIKFIIPILFLIFFIAIVISGNRMPLLLYLFLMVLVILFEKKTRKYFISFFLSASLIFLLLFNFNSQINNNLKKSIRVLCQIIIKNLKHFMIHG